MPAAMPLAFTTVDRLEHEGRLHAARAALTALPDTAGVWLRRGNLNLRFGDLDRAEACFSAALKEQPDLAEGLVGLAITLDRRGEPDRAAAALAPLIHQPDTPVRIIWAWARAQAQSDPAAVLDPVMRAAERAPRSARALLMHVLGDALDQLGQVDAAFFAIDEANRLRREPFDGAAHLASVRALINNTQRARTTSSLTSARSILVVGMPRSGTTLAESLLARHPQIEAAGELQDWRLIALDHAKVAGVGSWERAPDDVIASTGCGERYLRRLDSLAPPGSRVVDKTPANAMMLGFVASSLPNTTVVHCVRRPLDTAWSCYRQAFLSSLNFATSLQGLAFAMAAEREIMTHWKRSLHLPIIDVAYEDLVTDPEGALAPVISAAGLEWDPAVADRTRGGNGASTASYAEVRKPLYRTSVNRAEPYRAHLKPFTDVWTALGRST